MHVWPGYAGRLIKACRFCKEPIKAGEPIWYARNYSWKRWKKDYYYHMTPQKDWTRSCHDMEGVLYIDTHPDPGPLPRGMAGRSRLNLTLEERRKRTSLLVRGSQLRKDMLVIGEMRLPGYTERFKEKNIRYNQVKRELEEVGGVPMSALGKKSKW